MAPTVEGVEVDEVAMGTLDFLTVSTILDVDHSQFVEYRYAVNFDLIKNIGREYMIKM